MGFLTWILFGLIAGALAKAIMPGNQGMGWIMTILLGVVGASVGGWVGTFLGFGTVDGFNIGSLGIAVVGALIILFIYAKLTNNR